MIPLFLLLFEPFITAIFATAVYLISSIASLIAIYIKQVKDISDLKIQMSGNHENNHIKIKALENEIKAYLSLSDSKLTTMENALLKQTDVDNKLLEILNELKIVVTELNGKLNVLESKLNKEEKHGS